MQDENLTTTAAPDLCQFPGCENPVEQPAGGGPRKRFCSDQHRVQFWRQTRTERGDSPKRSAPETPSVNSPALALRSQLEQSVQTLEGVLTRTRTTLIELADLEEAEAVRAEAFSSADEQVARANTDRAAEERRRRAAENLAEAASSAARGAEDEMAVAQAEAERLRFEIAQVREEMVELETRTEEELAAAKEREVEQVALANQRADEAIKLAQVAAAAAQAEAQKAKQAQSAAEAQALQAREELEQIRTALRTANERATGLEQRLAAEESRHRDELAVAAERVTTLERRAEAESNRHRDELAAAAARFTGLEQRLTTEAERHRAETAAAAERMDKTQERLERALTDIRAETESRAKAETRALAAEQRIEELKSEVSGLRGEPGKSRKRDPKPE